MTTSLFLTFLSVIGVGIGQILFKLGSSRINSEQLISSIAFNAPLLIGLVIYAFATLAWIIALRGAPLSKLYPFFALAFVFVPILESAVFSTSLKPGALIGGAIIALGVFVAVRA